MKGKIKVIVFDKDSIKTKYLSAATINKLNCKAANKAVEIKKEDNNPDYTYIFAKSYVKLLEDGHSQLDHMVVNLEPEIVKGFSPDQVITHIGDYTITTFSVN